MVNSINKPTSGLMVYWHIWLGSV